MPPAIKRDCGIIMFDLHSSKRQVLLEGLLKITAHKWLLGSKDIYRLILCNSKVTNNHKNYPNINTTDIQDLDPKQILQCIENAESEQGDWLDGLLLAIYHLKIAATELAGTVTIQILFLTTLDRNPISLGESKIQSIIAGLKEHNIYLYIVGPKVKLNCTIMNTQDILRHKTNFTMDLSNASLAVAKRIMDSTENSIICNLKVGINLFTSYKLSRGSQPWKVPLSFGSNFNLPVNTVKVLRKDLVLKIAPNKRQQTVQVLAEDESIEVDPADLVRGFIRHGKLVKVENEMFKMEAPRSFDVLGFTGEKFIPEIYMRGDDTFYILPNQEMGEDSCQAFYCLVDVLKETRKYGIVRRIYNNNNKPKFFTLIPRPDLEPKCFIMVGLPYADDLRDNHMFNIPKPSGVKETDDDFTKFFNSLDVTSEDRQVDISLSPNMMIDWFSSNLTNVAVKKILNKDFEFEDVDIDYISNKGPNEFAEALKNVWIVKSDS